MRVALVLTLALAVFLVGCASGGSNALSAGAATTEAAPPTSTTAPPTTTTAAPTTTTVLPTTTTRRATTTTAPPVTLPGGLVIRSGYEVVQARGDIHALAGPAGASVQAYQRINELNALTTMLAVSPADSWGAQGWYEVLLPLRPNGSKGWVSSLEVDSSLVSTAIVVELGEHRLTLYDLGRRVATYPVGVGSAANPTPTGAFYVTGVLKTNPSGAYGPYAIGTSAFSDTLTDWPGGGVVGIHGTNVPSSVGKNVSHGCIRLPNDDITRLALAVSLGTPVFILP